MPNFASKLKRLFSKTKQEAVPEDPPQIIEDDQVLPEVEEDISEQRSSREIKCPHCGAPTDDFVKKCWLCKNDIYG